MSRSVRWSRDSRDDLAAVILEVRKNFGSRTAKKVIARFREAERIIADNPYIGTADADNPPFRVLHSKHSRIFYVVEEDIYIVAVWDNRQDDIRIAPMLKRRRYQKNMQDKRTRFLKYLMVLSLSVAAVCAVNFFMLDSWTLRHALVGLLIGEPLSLVAAAFLVRLDERGN